MLCLFTIFLFVLFIFFFSNFLVTLFIYCGPLPSFFGLFTALKSFNYQQNKVLRKGLTSNPWLDLCFWCHWTVRGPIIQIFLLIKTWKFIRRENFNKQDYTSKETQEPLYIHQVHWINLSDRMNSTIILTNLEYLWLCVSSDSIPSYNAFALYLIAWKACLALVTSTHAPFL